MTVEERYLWACESPSDIKDLIPTMRKYGEQCQHITEFGVNRGVSTSAWLAAKPKKLVCYDIVAQGESLMAISKVASENGIEFEFRMENTRAATIEPTDLLFVDTLHTAQHLKMEISQNHRRVAKFMVFHDTETFGICGENGAAGLWRCLLPFLIMSDWKICEHRPESNGLTVLKRIPRLQ